MMALATVAACVLSSIFVRNCTRRQVTAEDFSNYVVTGILIAF